MSWRDKAAQILKDGPTPKIEPPEAAPVFLASEIHPTDIAMIERRGRALSVLNANPGLSYAAHTTPQDDHVIVTLGIRGKGTVELHIPAGKWDGVLFVEMMDKRNFH